MPQLAEVFARHAGGYLAKYGRSVLPSHRRAIRDIASCRTDVMGGHVFRCDSCGREVYAYHSCRNRNCPKCRHKIAEDWLEARRGELLPVTYFHAVFTLPSHLRRVVRSHQRLLGGILMRAAAGATVKLGRDPHYVGGTVGVMTVLHTSGRNLSWHPHVHCLVTGGGLARDGTWLRSRKNYLAPVRALSKVFRGIVREAVTRALPDATLPESVWKKKWCVHCSPAPGATDAVLRYVARYVYRGIISNRSILAVTDTHVTFRYKATRTGKWTVTTLAAHEFMRRFLQHVLPRGFHKVRYYGLWSAPSRTKLRRLQLALGSRGAEAEPETSDGARDDDAPAPRHPLEGETCPHCGKGRLVYLKALPPRRDIPP
jgi:hypothetical protein